MSNSVSLCDTKFQTGLPDGCLLYYVVQRVLVRVRVAGAVSQSDTTIGDQLSQSIRSGYVILTTFNDITALFTKERADLPSLVSCRFVGEGGI